MAGRWQWQVRRSGRVGRVWARAASAGRGRLTPALRDAALAWAMATVIVAVAAGGLWASHDARRAAGALAAQRSAELAARQVQEWIAQQEAALVGVAAVGRGFTQIADQSYVTRALPEAVAVGWWEHQARDGGVLTPEDGAQNLWLLTVLAGQPFRPHAGVQLARIELPDGAPGVLFVVPEPQGESPWQTVLGAAFDTQSMLAALVTGVPDLADTALSVRDGNGALLYTGGAASASAAVPGVARLRAGADQEWQVRAVPAALTGNGWLGSWDDLFFVVAVLVAGLFGVSATRLARQRDATVRALRLGAAASARQRRALEASADAVLIMDDAGVIQWCNRAAEAMFGVPSTGLVGQLWGRYLPGELGAEHWRDLGTTPWPPRNVRPGEVGTWEACRADGTVFPAEVLLTAYRGSDLDERTTVTAFVRDVSTRRQLEARARQSERLEALGRLAGGVAHDFNNILTAIVSRVEMLQSAHVSAEKRTRHLTKLSEAVDAATDLVEQLLAMARERPDPPQALDLNACVERHARLLRSAQCQHVRMDMDLAHELPQIVGDASQMGQVVLNLCVNAAQATPPGGRIRLRTRALRRGAVVLEVGDTGAGIDPADVPHIFEPFYTTKDAEGGTGLGLATVYGIVQAHGGEIAVESTLGHGTTFTVTLPALDPDAELLEIDPLDLRQAPPSRAATE